MRRSRIFSFLFHLCIRFANIFDREESGILGEFTLLKLKLDRLLIHSYSMILIWSFRQKASTVGWRTPYITQKLEYPF